MCEWQTPYYWGRHERRQPADDGIPYRYDPRRNGNQYWPYPRMDYVSRAIVADGTVNSKPSWENSPQVAFWLNEEPKTILERFRQWWEK